MNNRKNKSLILASFGSALAALAHLGCIIFGASWYRFFGAGEQMAKLAEQGHWYPTIVTSFITFILVIWSLYGLSGAKVITRLPFIRLILMAIAAIYLFRAVASFWLIPLFPDNSVTFWLISSGICLAMGLLYAFGLYQSWNQLEKNCA